MGYTWDPTTRIYKIRKQVSSYSIRHLEDDDDDEDDEDDEDGEENNNDETQPMEHDQQVTDHGDWLGATPGQNPSDSQGRGKWQHTGSTSQQSSYMPTPSSQSENSEVMEMSRNMQIHPQKFSTLQEERFMALQDQLQIQSENSSSFTTLQEERYSNLRNQIQTHSDNFNSFSSTIMQWSDATHRYLSRSSNTLNWNIIEFTNLYEQGRPLRQPSGYRGRNDPSQERQR
ncbi:uncharacterized protein LOC127136324 [Lathyrus oleraceus]|uniref:uncharacterized protein LOC127136324 n=1 Tax=Pisum sativum TaxID=3888 RepID=UPI0021D0EAF3|nr:uncharacterized protein LOC127136324 [Pisum sativum]